MKRIYLMGYMGAGKTTLGKALSTAMNLQFIDLDWYIEERFHRTIRDLFAERGETGFRTLEQNMLHEISEFEDVVISTGGGTPCFFDNISYMKSKGQTVFLEVSPEVLYQRLKDARSNRPLLKGKTDDELKETILRELAKRMPFYNQAHYTFKADHIDNKEQIRESAIQLKTLLENNII